MRSENAGFTKSRRVIGEHVSHPLVGWRTSDQDGWGLRSNLICRGIFEDFHAESKGNLYSKIETPRRKMGLREFLTFGKETLTGPWLYKDWVAQLLAEPFQWQLE